MIKTVNLLKRKSGMSMQEFIDYYEKNHRLIGEKVLRGHACRYVRRFLHPVEDPRTGETHEAEFDVLMEIWYPDQAAMERARDSIANYLDEIYEDEAKLFAPGSMRSFTVEEYESEV